MPPWIMGMGMGMGKRDTIGAKRASALAASYQRVRAATEKLCEPLCIEDYGLQSMPDASPPKWHLAHTTWFFETFVLENAVENFRPYNPAYRYLFNSYYNTVGQQWTRSDRGLLSRPTVDEIYAYRRHIDEAIVGITKSGLSEELFEVITLGLHHEEQHQELILMDLKHALALNPLRPVYATRTPESPACTTAPIAWVQFDRGIYSFGNAGTDFCFDNETPQHESLVGHFEIANRLITNHEYLKFIQAGGYQQPELWLSDGWATVQTEHWEAPLYWRREGSQYFHFTLNGYEPVEMEAPVSHISYYEADAFARWSEARLPTEYEWELATQQAGHSGVFLEEQHYRPRTAPNAAPHNKAHQLFGDLWEWTQSPYSAYPNYSPPVGALGEYNGKFMCNQMVLRGGSFATPREHIRATYRNFFPPHARWMFSGLRLARSPK